LDLDWVETTMSRDVLIQASMLPDAVRNASEDEVDFMHFVLYSAAYVLLSAALQSVSMCITVCAYFLFLCIYIFTTVLNKEP